MPEKKIILIGGGGHCRSCIDVIESSNIFKIAGIVEQSGKNKTETILGYPVIGSDNDLKTLKAKYEYALITIGQMGPSQPRQRIFKYLKKQGYILPVIVSPLAHVSKHATIEQGTIVMHQVVVNAGVVIGENCILNTRCLIEHDATIGDHTHISTAAVINGSAMIGSGSFVGSNAIVVQGVNLPKRYFFKAGSLILSEGDGRAVEDKNI